MFISTDLIIGLVVGTGSLAPAIAMTVKIVWTVMLTFLTSYILVPLLDAIMNMLQDKFIVSCTFREPEVAYHWMMTWILSLESWSQVRNGEVTLDPTDMKLVNTFFKGEESHVGRSVRPEQKTFLLPARNRLYYLKHKGHIFTIRRTFPNAFNKASNGNLRCELEVNILTHNMDVLSNLISEAREYYEKTQHDNVCIYQHNDGYGWVHQECRRKRRKETVFLPLGFWSNLFKDAQSFFDEKTQNWYQSRGVPYKRGYLFYGAPGTGKSTTVHALASELGVHIYNFRLADPQMCDKSLSILMSNLPKRCIAVMEDIDVAFMYGVNDRNATITADFPRNCNKLTLSGLLNAIDGVSGGEGRLLIATTNNKTTLDSAFLRVGRIDKEWEFPLVSKFVARQMFQHFYGCGEQAETIPEYSDEKQEAEIGSLARTLGDNVSKGAFSTATFQGYLIAHKEDPRRAVDEFEDWQAGLLSVYGGNSMEDSDEF